MKPYYFDNHIRIFKKDCRSMDELPDESVDLIATDPPYGISFMGKDWDRALPDKRIWKECLRILKPGAFAFVMSIPRADCLSRMTIALEDTGFLVNFTPIFWAYASGFPKAQNIGKAVDKRLGAEREDAIKGGHRGIVTGLDGHGQTYNPDIPHTINCGSTSRGEAVSPQAKALDGSYGGFQPKPAVEVILVAMKPLSEKTFVDQALKNGKGITWLDSTRIPYENVGDKMFNRRPNLYDKKYNPKGSSLRPHNAGGHEPPNPTGRFPANLLVSDDVLNDGKVTRSKSGMRGLSGRHDPGQGAEHNRIKPYTNTMRGVDDSGSFSRYFDLDAWWEERIKQLPESVQRTFPFLIVPKASKSEKNEGCEDLEERRADAYAEHRGRRMERKERFDGKPTSRGRNYHPTVKPIKLMSYLITLGSREGDIVVDPFIGTGSTAIACQILGRRCAGYEINPDYCEIAKGRLTWCRQQVLL